jgi:quinone-modifying oxidoreductase subunit QmoC
LAIFYGFLGLVITTTSVAIGIYLFRYLTPWPLWHPVKILGNVSGVAVLAACWIFLSKRREKGERAGKNDYTDWLFLDVLGATALTGFLCELLRLGGSAGLAYPMYFIHLVLIFFLLVYLPYSKFAHLIYRPVAMLHEAASATARKVDR